MSLMHPSPPSRIRHSEPGGFTLFLLFFGSLIAAGIIGVWLWNSSPAVHEGRAFGTPNQVGTGAPAAGAATKPGPAAAGGTAASDLDPALVQKGQQLAQQFSCIGCHTTTGQQSVGPSWKGLYGSQKALANGQTVTADDAYIKESITDPDAKIVRGFNPGLMSATVKPLEPQIQQGDNLDALVAYIKSLK
jgi:cytochrome c551/c552